MQLDAEEEGQTPYYKPPPESTSVGHVPTPADTDTASEPATATDVALEQDA